MKRFYVCLIMVIVLATSSMAQSRRSRPRTSSSKPSIIYGSPSASKMNRRRASSSKQSILKIAEIGESPAFSPDGTKIAFMGRNGTIWIKDIGRKNLREVSSSSSGTQPSWSPDGKMIAFTRYGGIGEKLSIWVIDLEGKNARQLVRPMPDQGDQWPCWSPDGKYIVLSHGNQLWIVNSDGSNAHPLTLKPAKEYEYCGQWSPKGDFLAYIAINDHGQEDYPIRIIDPAGREQAMASHGIVASRVKWSKDGKSLFYMSHEGISYTGPVPHQIMKIDLYDKRPAQQLTELPYNTQVFDISPDESWIVYDTPEEGSSSIYIKRLPRAAK